MKDEPLDPLFLSMARRALDDCERYTAENLPAMSVRRARDAFRALALVIAKHDEKRAVVDHLTGRAAE